MGSRALTRPRTGTARASARPPSRKVTNPVTGISSEAGATAADARTPPGRGDVCRTVNVVDVGAPATLSRTPALRLGSHGVDPS